MRVLIITSSPNKDGLTAACGEQARLGSVFSGVDTTVVNLNEMDIAMCKACDRGWGACRNQNVCQQKDDFQKLHITMNEMDGFIFVTPVYWWDMSESAKAFVDRLRRCEAFKKEGHYLSNKPFVCIAAAGGTGNGVVSCLTTMEKFVDHVKGLKYDFIGVTKRNKDYKLKTIYEAAKSMANELMQTRTI
ncbi:MAG: iron-sulfur protein [Clostridiaceae bacterium BRH_c20a]|nr:MAG: iron-sulfur protein [Clostridiaceae bacterium BRH_c20a]